RIESAESCPLADSTDDEQPMQRRLVDHGSGAVQRSLNGKRHPEFSGIRSSRCSKKTSWTNADDCHRVSVDIDRSSDNRLVERVSLLPDSIADDGDGRSTRNVIARSEEPTGRWLEAKCREVVTRHQLADVRLNYLIPSAHSDAAWASLKRRQLHELGSVIAEI